MGFGLLDEVVGQEGQGLLAGFELVGLVFCVFLAANPDCWLRATVGCGYQSAPRLFIPVLSALTQAVIPDVVLSSFRVRVAFGEMAAATCWSFIFLLRGVACSPRLVVVPAMEWYSD